MSYQRRTGHQYNGKIHVLSYGIILYDFLSGAILANCVAMAGDHDELLDHARKVTLPARWSAQVRVLISACDKKAFGTGD